MMDAKAAERMLASIALDQGGYFTAKQALSVGYSYQNQRYHALNGDWIRAARGIYRLQGFPTQLQEELIILTLLSSNRAGTPQAVVSHETALTVHEISDANPAKIDLTVPVGFRKRMPASVILHHAGLSPRDWEDRGGYRVTTVLRTILDIASDPVSWPLLNDAVRDALREGMIRIKLLLAANVPDEVKARLRSAANLAQHSTSNTIGKPNTTPESTDPGEVTWKWRRTPQHSSRPGITASEMHGAKNGAS